MTPHIDLVSEIRTQRSILTSLKIKQAVSAEKDMSYYDENIEKCEKIIRDLERQEKRGLICKMILYALIFLVLMRIACGFVVNNQ